MDNEKHMLCFVSNRSIKWACLPWYWSYQLSASSLICWRTTQTCVPYYQMFYKCNTTGATSAAGTAYPTGSHELTPVCSGLVFSYRFTRAYPGLQCVRVILPVHTSSPRFVVGSCCSIFNAVFCIPLFFSICPLYFWHFILITPLVYWSFPSSSFLIN